MGSAFTTRFRTAVVVLLVVLASMSAATACGSGSDGSSTDDPTTTMADSGVGRALTCAAKAEMFDAAVAKVTSPVEGDPSAADWSSIVDDLASLSPTLPSSIRDDWSAYVDAMRTAADAMRSVDLSSAGTDPTMAAKLAAAADALDAPSVSRAIENIYVYFAALCPPGD